MAPGKKSEPPPVYAGKMFDPSFCRHCNVNKLDPKGKYFLPNGIAVGKECAERHGSGMAKRNAGRRPTMVREALLNREQAMAKKSGRL